MTKDEILEQVYCIRHTESPGPFNKDSELQKEHESKSDGECKFVKYDPKKHNKKYKESKISDNKSKDNRSQSRILFDFALSKIIKLYIADNNKDEVYALVQINHHIELLDLSSIRAIQWLTNECSQIIDTDELYGEDFYRKVVHTIKSQCQMNDTQRVRIYRRIAHLDDSIWYDLGDDSWNALKITKKGISNVPLDEKSPLFNRTQSTYMQVNPKYGDSKALHELTELLRINPNDSVVFMVHVVCFFLESIPIPIMVFDGTAGSIKTTVTSVIKRIVDPSGSMKDDNVSAIAKKPDDLILQLYNRYISSFDNVSYIDEEISDIFCRAITGSSNTKRKLYTDGSEVILNFMRKIVLNGVVPTLEYPDLQTRLLNYERIPIDETNLITDKEFKQKIDELIPRVLGHVFSILSNTLKDFDKLSRNIKPKTRLADFEIWGEIISQKLGFDKKSFLDRYYEKLKEETIKTQDAYPIISAIQNLMSDKEFYEDSASNLYATLRGITESNGVDLKTQWVKFPKGSNKLVKHLKTIQSNLNTCGFVINNYHYTKGNKTYTQNASMVSIQRKQKQQTLDVQKVPSQPSLSSLDSENTTNQAQNEGKTIHGNSECTSEGKNINKVPSLPSSLKNDDSRHEKTDSEGCEDSEDKFQLSAKQSENGSSKPIIVKNLQEAKQKLQNSNFEIWNNGTVKCKLCNGKMDIPGAINHTCQKRKKSAGVSS